MVENFLGFIKFTKSLTSPSASTGTNFVRKDTQKSKAGKQIDLQRRQKKIKAEKDRLTELRKIGNVKMPKDTITNLYKMI